MKSLHGLDIHYLLQDLQILKNGKISKILQLSKADFLFRFHISGKGQVHLRIALPGLIFLTSSKKAPLTAPAFCISLRKYLTNTFLIDIKQTGLERILEFEFKTREGKIYLMLELFSKGNLIICDENYKILLPLRSQTWKDRTIKRGATYRPPAPKHNPLTLTEKEFIKILSTSKKENLVKTIALDISLGGKYAEELCNLSALDKNMKQESLTPEHFRTLFKHLKELASHTLDPQNVYQDHTLIDISPFPLSIYKKSSPVKSFSKAIESIAKKEDQFKSKFDKKIMQTEKIIASLQENLKELQERAEDQGRKAEILYENYAKVDALLKYIFEKRNKTSLKDLQKKLKSHHLLKKIIPQKQTIIIEL